MVYANIRLLSFRLIFIHPTSVIRCSSQWKFGKGLNVDRGCYINAMSKKGLVCGENVSIGYHTHVELSGTIKSLGEGMIIGNNVGLGTHGHYGSGSGMLTIGDNTIFGNYVSIHPENHNFDDITKPIREQGVRSTTGVFIGKDCWIGAKATILDGTHIGNHCIVAAGAVVCGTFPDYCVLGGIPAKIIKRYNFETNIWEKIKS